MSDTTNNGSTTSASDPELLSPFEEIHEGKCYDPKEALKTLVREVGSRLSARLPELEQRYYRSRDSLDAYARRWVDSGKQALAPLERDYEAARTRADTSFVELEGLEREFEKTPKQLTYRRRHLVSLMSKKLRDIDVHKRTIEEYGAALSGKIERTEAILPLAREVWDAVTLLERLPLKVSARLLWADLTVRLVSILFLCIAFFVALGLDRVTPIAEHLAGSLKSVQPHVVTIAALFGVQVLLFEPWVERLRTALHWRSYERMLLMFRKTVEEVSAAERKLAAAEETLSRRAGSTT